jgi:hypothetical protein
MVWNQGWQAAQVLSGRDFLKAVLALVLLLGVMAAGGRDFLDAVVIPYSGYPTYAKVTSLDSGCAQVLCIHVWDINLPLRGRQMAPDGAPFNV